MIKLIGVKRAVILIFILAVNVVIGATFLTGVAPLHADADLRLKQTSARISALSNDIQGIKSELAAFPANHEKYKALEKKGFFLPQDRFQAGRVLDDLRERSRLLGYSYKIDAIRTVPDAETEKNGGKLIHSRIRIEKISSVLDMNVYALLNNLSVLFPHHARIQGFEVRKTRKVDAASLDAVARGADGMITAEAVVDWLTIVPQEENTGQETPDGFRGR